MIAPAYTLQGLQVALRKESVDRNCALLRAVGSFTVALRKESVDRNACDIRVSCLCCVALRKESVDRNMLCLLFRPVVG